MKSFSSSDDDDDEEEEEEEIELWKLERHDLYIHISNGGR